MPLLVFKQVPLKCLTNIVPPIVEMLELLCLYYWDYLCMPQLPPFRTNSSSLLQSNLSSSGSFRAYNLGCSGTTCCGRTSGYTAYSVFSVGDIPVEKVLLSNVAMNLNSPTGQSLMPSAVYYANTPLGTCTIDDWSLFSEQWLGTLYYKYPYLWTESKY